MLGVVAVDDVWGLLLFSLSLTVVSLSLSVGGSLEGMAIGLWEIIGAILVGLLLGIPFSYLSGRIKAGEPTQIEVLGIIFLCVGFAMAAQVSFLLASIVLGAVIINFARHHNRTFHEVERIDHPFLVLFFILAGASVHMEELFKIAGLGSCYVASRIIGTWAGSWFGASIIGEDRLIKNWMGLSLLPQAGVALGMALVASEHFPPFRSEILAVTIGSTVIFELIGPILTRLIIQKT